MKSNLILNFPKNFQILFKTPNKTVPYPVDCMLSYNRPLMQTPNINKDYILEMGNTEFVSMPPTKFLGILDDAINFKCHISE